MGQGAVAGQQEQALRVHVQPPHRPHPFPAIPDQVRHSGPALLIGQGGHHPSGLVQHQHLVVPPPAHRHAVQGNLVPVRVRPFPQDSGPAVHCDPALLYVGFRPAAGAHSRRGEDLLQTIFHRALPFYSLTVPALEKRDSISS